MSEHEPFTATVRNFDHWRAAWLRCFQTQDWTPAEVEGDRVYFRRGFPHPDWSAYGIDVSTDLAVVLSLTTERRNEPLVSVEAVFSRTEDAEKFVIATIADLVRIAAKQEPIFWQWEDAGIDPRLGVAKVTDSDLAVCKEIRGLSHLPAAEVFTCYFTAGDKASFGLVSNANAPLSRVILMSFDDMDHVFNSG